MRTVVTTAEAAELAGLTPSAFRVYMARLRTRGQDFRRPGPDARTPMWDAELVREWAATRPRR